jgi:acetyl esterase/lipase
VAPAADTVVPGRTNENPPTTRLTNVTRPQMVVYRPDAEANTGVAIVVCPGGGFNHLAWDKEGTEVAQWLSTIGITGVALKYRCPTKQDRATQHVGPLQDAQRAMSLLRSRAEQWNIDPQQIGVLGFSAGGHVAARLALHPGEREYESIDAADEHDWAPAFAVLLYPAYLLNEQQDGLDTQAFHVKQSSPPMFVAYAQDDRIPSPGALYLAIALQQAGVSCELHQYAAGGHGYGMRQADVPAITWPARLQEWLRQQGRLPESAAGR